MALAEYKQKRRFSSTPEPQGGKGSGGAFKFVVQKHAASHLHYDFRLELEGVLLSWAVPKGPSLNPADKRLAMKVEDHPMDYRLFEGTIPAGNYGAGTVMVWDEGTYTDFEESEDPAAARKHLKAGFKKGDLKFVLHGQKLSGAFVLAKMGNDRGENSWLLIKKKDAFASTADVTKQDRSVLSERSLEEIAKGGGRQWLKAPKLDLGAAPKRKPPAEVSPMLATLAKEPFDDPDWLYEVKWDGYRIIAHVQEGRVRLSSRGNKDYTAIFGPVAEELASLKVDCVLDGEVVILDKEGRSDFGALQNYQRTGAGNLAYYVFDVPYAAGRDLRGLPLEQRKAVAAAIVEPLELVRYSDHIKERGRDFFRLAEQQGLEGIMAKAASSTYSGGRRSREWLKLKTHARQEAVIGGFTAPRGGRKQLGALVLGVYDGKGKLQYISHTGGGLNDKLLKELRQRLAPLEQPESPFATTPKTNAPVTWVQPELLCEVSFAGWTQDGHMRQPIFLGLREDKDPKTVRKEEAVKTPVKTQKSDKKATRVNGREDISGGIETKAELTHLDKVYWPKEKYTKGDLISYYSQMADIILPYLKDRPQSMNRHPNGIKGDNFFQKNVEKHPSWVKTVPIFSESNNKDLHWLVCNDRDTLLYMANLGCIELNPWHSRTGKLEKPDYCLIDLDAKSCGFETVVKVAQEVRRLLDDLEVPSVPKTSGKTGLHVCIPLGAKYSYEQSKQFAQLIVGMVNERMPELTSVERNPAKRKNKIYLDYLQNRTGQTMAAPYCVRPVPGATVSTPLKWSEVRKGLDPTRFTIKTIGKRLDKVGDLWEPALGRGGGFENGASSYRIIASRRGAARCSTPLGVASWPGTGRRTHLRPELRSTWCGPA